VVIGFLESVTADLLLGVEEDDCLLWVEDEDLLPEKDFEGFVAFCTCAADTESTEEQEDAVDLEDLEEALEFAVEATLELTEPFLFLPPSSQQEHFPLSLLLPLEFFLFLFPPFP